MAEESFPDDPARPLAPAGPSGGDAADALVEGSPTTDPFMSDPGLDDPFSAEIAGLDASDWDIDTDTLWGPLADGPTDFDLPF
ncbi:hypothetical protein [Microbacterium sp. NPDC058389]|uniref:hypothetical protein n=1 Tax=Microbacterium sp. NPDC058389 TaxID=3346475 RepID=UPI00364752FF